MGSTENAVADRIGEGRIGDVVMPVLGIELAGDNRAPSLLSVFQHLEKIASL
jgi:hypothetical protein